jgi:anaerobic magnesium-protoporphyrin IX monomethyl ester cyclase
VDELTNVSKKWCLEFCDLLESENTNITYVINGARADNADEQLLRRFKQTGCIKISFGYESGSQKILDYIGKGVSKEKNYETAKLMKKVRLHDTPQIVIGFPPESPETIKETTEFMQSLVPITPSINYILPFPKTRDWEYCLEKGLIKDEEEFILNYDEAWKFRINLTKYPDRIVKKWQSKIKRDISSYEARKYGRYIRYAIYGTLERVL